jgi:O-methyltransferase involved in polyketide biosynthesis
MIDPPAAATDHIDGEAEGGPVPLVSDEELGPVARTLLITLWARAAESRRPDALRHDPDAARLLPRIEHDFARYERGTGGGWKTQVGVAVRGRRIDEAVRRFCTDHPDGLVIELGAGLDGRSRRLGGPENDWLLVDLPDVIAVRRRLLPPAAAEHLHPGSLTDPGWIDAARRLGDRPRLIIAEGVLMFVARASVAATLAAIAERLPGTRVVADAIGGLMVRFPWLHDTLPGSGVRFAWGLRHPREPESWHPGVRVDGIHPLILDGGARWRWMRLLRPVPAMRRQFVLLELTCSARRHRPAGLPAPHRPSA